MSRLRVFLSIDDEHTLWVIDQDHSATPALLGNLQMLLPPTVGTVRRQAQNARSLRDETAPFHDKVVFKLPVIFGRSARL